MMILGWWGSETIALLSGISLEPVCSSSKWSSGLHFLLTSGGMPSSPAQASTLENSLAVRGPSLGTVDISCSVPPIVWCVPRRVLKCVNHVVYPLDWHLFPSQAFPSTHLIYHPQWLALPEFSMCSFHSIGFLHQLLTAWPPSMSQVAMRMVLVEIVA